MIFYYCPELTLKSGRLRCLYRHVQLLSQGGVEAAILHTTPGFRLDDVPEVPLEYLNRPYTFKNGDIVVIPEACPDIMQRLQFSQARRFAIALSWSQIFLNLSDGVSWRDWGIERVITLSPVVSEFVSWSMSLPVHELPFSIDATSFYWDGKRKRPKVAYQGRKSQLLRPLKRALTCRDRQLVSEVVWCELNNLSLADYASELRDASVFLALSTSEALNISVYEAMASGCIVAGFHGVGLRDVMHGMGPDQNCVLAENGDYATLACRLEPLLRDVASGEMERWRPIVDKAQSVAAQHTLEQETERLQAFWHSQVSSSL